MGLLCIFLKPGKYIYLYRVVVVISSYLELTYLFIIRRIAFLASDNIRCSFGGKDTGAELQSFVVCDLCGFGRCSVLYLLPRNCSSTGGGIFLINNSNKLWLRLSNCFSCCVKKSRRDV